MESHSNVAEKYGLIDICKGDGNGNGDGNLTIRYCSMGRHPQGSSGASMLIMMAELEKVMAGLLTKGLTYPLSPHHHNVRSFSTTNAFKLNYLVI